jgi:hypothetical protein
MRLTPLENVFAVGRRPIEEMMLKLARTLGI